MEMELELELEVQPAPQATGQAKPAGSSHHGSQDALPVQNTNGEAKETANLEATALQTAEQHIRASGDHNERRRSTDSARPLSRVTTAIESIRSAIQSQLKAHTSFNEDGVHVWTCTLTLNKAVIFFVVHFVIVFVITFVGFFLQVWSTFHSSPTGISLEQMQQLLQTSANEGSRRVLAAFEYHVGDENVNWKSLVQVLKACLDYSVSSRDASDLRPS
jgi:hypothetical protein